MVKKCLLFGVDIETGGPVVNAHPLLAVGFCIYSWDGRCRPTDGGLELLDTIEVHIAADTKEYEPETLDWWQKQSSAWEVVKSNCIPKREAAEKLVEFLKKWQKVALDKHMEFKTITDNCWFDDTWTSWFLCTYGSDVGGKPLRHNYYSGYTKVDNMIDLNQRTKAATADLGIRLGRYRPSVPHDHTPVSDARGIVERYVNYMNETTRTVPAIAAQAIANITGIGITGSGMTKPMCSILNIK